MRAQLYVHAQLRDQRQSPDGPCALRRVWQRADGYERRHMQLEISPSAVCGQQVSAGKVTCGDELVSYGLADVPYASTRIVTKGRRLDDGEVGSIWVHSGLVASGYCGLGELDQKHCMSSLEGESGWWLDTGRLMGGKCYVTDRLQDVSIVQGRSSWEHTTPATYACRQPLRSSASTLRRVLRSLTAVAQASWTTACMESGIDSLVVARFVGALQEKMIRLQLIVEHSTAQVRPANHEKDRAAPRRAAA